MSNFAQKFGWVLVLTILALFLFPLHFGSFTATHGPITALRTLMAVQLLLATIALCVSIAISMIDMHQLSEVEVAVGENYCKDSSLTLRC